MSENKHILVVEDERPLAEAIKIKLESTGFNVTVSQTVADAKEALDSEKNFDAMWLDHYLLGKESGLDLVAKLKEEGSKWRELPVFVVSNTASPDKVQSYIQLGVENYYVKSDHSLESIINDIKEQLK